MRVPALAPTLMILAALILGAMGVGYYLTVEPAPVVRIRWVETVSETRRAELERQFLLVRPRAESPRTIDYDLLDTSWDNVVAIVRHPEVDDTRGIRQQPYEIPFDAPYGESWMWVAHRMPGLRVPGVPRAIVTASGLVLAGGVMRLFTRRRAGTTRPFPRSRRGASRAGRRRR
jgi:hypothetical protein